MKKTTALALVLVVFMFSAAIATATIRIPRINALDRTLRIETDIVLCGDPIGDPGPPGVYNGSRN